MLCFCFCGIKALLVHSDRCRAVKCRIGVTVVLIGERGDVRMEPSSPHQTTWSQPTSPFWAADFLGCGSKSAAYPVDDDHQAQITWGVRGWAMHTGEDKRGIGCDSVSMKDSVARSLTKRYVTSSQYSQLQNATHPDVMSCDVAYPLHTSHFLGGSVGRALRRPGSAA